MADFATIVQKLVAPMHRRVMLMIGRAIVTLVDDSKTEQILQLQLLDGYKRDGVERIQEYGFTSVPLPNASAVTVAVTGDTDHLLAIATGDRRYRPKNLNPGEVALYTNEGTVFRAKNGGGIDVGINPTNYAALANKVDTEIARLWAYIGTHTHAETGGTTAAPSQTIPTPSATGSTTVRVT